MNVSIRHPAELTPAERGRWSALRAEGPGWDAPFLSLEFFELLAEVRGGVEIGVIYDGGEPVGFLPFERSGSAARPAGMRVVEIQGLLAPAGLDWNPTDVLRELDITAWHYGCVPVGQTALLPHHLRRRTFPVIDLSRGWEAYLTERKQAGSHYMKQAQRKARKMHRECGPLRFAWHEDDPDLLDRLIAWKSEQYIRTGTLDLMRFDWVLRLLHRARQASDERLSGVLSVLYCDERPAAVHLGLRSGPVLCWWLTTYDPRFAPHSPGMILTMHMLESATEQGVARIHLGQGDERYKQSLANSHFEVAEGTVSLSRWNRFTTKRWIQARDWAQSAPLCAAPLRVFRAVRNRMIHTV